MTIISENAKADLGHSRPSLPATHYVDNRIFTDSEIFRKEQDAIFKRSWLFVCHVSEVPAPGDFRVTKAAGQSIIIVRGRDGIVRGFNNVCRHRSAELVRTDAGNAKSFTCFYHRWSYALTGELLNVAKPAGYESVRLDKSELNLIPVRVEILLDLVFVTVNPDAVPLESFLGDILEPLREPMGTSPLEVVHFHKAIIKTNWKLWQDNNSERYHSLLHWMNMKTLPWVLGETSPMKLRIFKGGHSGYWSAGSATVAYKDGGYEGISGFPLPGLQTDEMRVVNLFPDVMINIRSNIIRIDRMTPLEPGVTEVEWRGLAVKGDSPEARAIRLRHHNLAWGPAGRNIPEDILAVESQWRAMQSAVVRYSILAREEELNPTDDANVRAYYQTWGQLMGVEPSNPFSDASGG